MQTALPGRSSQNIAEPPVDDATYNVLMALASKLEAIDTYRKYAADQLLQELRGRLNR